MKIKPYISWPSMRGGQYVVVIRESPSPIAKEIKVFQCGTSAERAFQTYRLLMKEQGRGF